MADQGFKDAYREELKRLTQPEKALINMLSMLAEDNKPQAQAIVTALELHLHECTPQARLPALYLIDSIIKNVKEPYITLFSKRIEHVFGRVWDSMLPGKDGRDKLTRLCNLWDGYLPPDVLARVKARMSAQTVGQKAPTAVPVLQQPRQPLAGHQQPHVQVLPPNPQPQQQHQQPQQHPPPQQLQHIAPAPLPPAQHPGPIILAQGQQLIGGMHLMGMQPAPPPSQQTIFVMGPHGQLVPVLQAMPQQQQQPTIILQQAPPPMQAPMQAIPQHMLPGLPPVSPAHPAWQQQPPPQPPRPMQPPQQQQHSQSSGIGPMVRRSPAMPTASPHHRPGTSPQHASAPTSGARSGSPAAQAQHIAASLDSLLQGLTRSGYLNDPALKTTSFDPAFIKKEHKGVIALLKSASDSTRARFKDIQFQRNKRRKAAAASMSRSSRSWYLPVSSWIMGTTTAVEAAEPGTEEAEGEEGPAPPPTLDADPTQTQCAISHEPFDSFYDQDRETWVYRGAVRLSGPEAERYGVPPGSIVKVECLAEADLGSSPAALAAAAAAGGVGGEEDEADLAAAAAGAPAAGQQQQAAAATGDTAAAAAEERKPQVLVKAEPAELEGVSGCGGDAIKLDPAAEPVAIKQQQQQQNGTGSLQQQATAAAAGTKRESADVEQQQEGTPSKKQRVSP